MLKSLYFKLDDQNEKHKKIIDFFDQVSKDQKKIDVLYYMVSRMTVKANDENIGLNFPPENIDK